MTDLESERQQRAAKPEYGRKLEDLPKIQSHRKWRGERIRQELVTGRQQHLITETGLRVYKRSRPMMKDQLDLENALDFRGADPGRPWSSVRASAPRCGGLRRWAGS
jgi:hypothetical protein